MPILDIDDYKMETISYLNENRIYLFDPALNQSCMYVSCLTKVVTCHVKL